MMDAYFKAFPWQRRPLWFQLVSGQFAVLSEGRIAEQKSALNLTT
jgi:hypothetical protein